MRKKIKQIIGKTYIKSLGTKKSPFVPGKVKMDNIYCKICQKPLKIARGQIVFTCGPEHRKMYRKIQRES